MYKSRPVKEFGMSGDAEGEYTADACEKNLHVEVKNLCMLLRMLLICADKFTYRTGTCNYTNNTALVQQNKT